MRYQCTITRRSDGRWSAQHTSDLGNIEITADTRDSAIQKIEQEVRYRVEMCPCTGRAFGNLEIEFVDR